MSFPTSPTEGQIHKDYIYNSTKAAWDEMNLLDGSSQEHAAPSGFYLANKYPELPSGLYWIQSGSMPNPLQMYVDMTEEGGGFDFYPITNGISVKEVTNTHSGTPLGLDLIMPRSAAHFKAIRSYIYNILGSTENGYLKTIPVYRNTELDGTGGVYSTHIMNSSYPGTPDWRVKDGGRWWLRDTVHTEPNGDYDYNGLLHIGTSSYIIDPSTGALSGFNDYPAAHVSNKGTGVNYIVSTNLKP